MSNVSDLGLDLENLFQPAWAQGKTEANRFERFTGNEGVKPERRRGEGRGAASFGPRREGPGGGAPFGERRGPRPPRAGGKFGDRNKGFFRRDDRIEREEREAPEVLPDVGVTFLPDDKGVESIARQIKMTGRAYPLFDIARLILQKPERYAVRLDVKKKPDGAVAQAVLICALDDTPWLSEDEAVAHVLKNHFATFYQADRTAIEPPKGKYTFVAQCGMSGVILGPPNLHDYQNQLRKLHAERFSRMPFDVFKSRVKIVKDEAVVKKWVEEQSFKTEYTCLNLPEPLKLPNLEEVEKHFRATHKESIIKSAESHVVAGVPSRSLRCGGLQRLIRAEWEQQRYFPLQLAGDLCKRFAGLGLQFFKVNKTVTHVGVARPLFLDLETTPVSDGIKRIVNFINSTPRCTRKKLVETLAPSPKSAEAPAAPAPETKRCHHANGCRTARDARCRADAGTNRRAGGFALVDSRRLRAGICGWPDGNRKETAAASAETGEETGSRQTRGGTEAVPATEPVPQGEATLPAEAAIEPAGEIAAPYETAEETADEPGGEAEQPASEIAAPVETAAPAPEAAPPDENPITVLKIPAGGCD